MKGMEKRHKAILKYFVAKIMNKLCDDKVKKIDSNYFHFVIYNIVEKFKNDKVIGSIGRGWYYHGPYIFLLDDILIEFGMNPKYHQLKSKSKEKFDFCETEMVKK